MPGPFASNLAVFTTDKRPKAVSDGRIPPAPSWLDKSARKVYKDTAKRMSALGVAGTADQATIAIYSLQYSRLQQFAGKEKRELSEERLLNELQSSVLGLAKELGLTPAGRARMRVAKMDDGTSPLDELMVADKPEKIETR
jgi:phage terminase small subunit